MIQVRLRPEVEAQIAAEAEARGMRIDRYIEELVEEHSATGQKEDFNRERAVEEMLAFARDYKLTLDGLKLDDLIHEGHEY